MAGSWFTGRPLKWDGDAQRIEQERQRWVYERIGRLNEAVAELAVDPARQYAVHRDAYVETGDMVQFGLMLEYVR